ncbi:MAG: glycosyl transferase group 1 [Frankiales bacterium]|nr:glycosyl transferase group 1 [Frankiales bacterium]
MRVAVLIQGFAPRIGGAERQLLAVLPLVQRLGVEVVVLTRRYPGLAGYEEVRGIPVHRLPVPGPRPAASLSYTMTAQGLLRRLRPDVLHSHELLSPTTTAMLAKTHLHVPTIAKVLSGGELEALKQRPLGRSRLQLWLRHVDYFHVVSREIDQALGRLGVPAERRLCLPNGVDVEHFRPVTAAEKHDLRARLGLPEAAPVAVYTGRLSPEKGIELLLEAWKAVVQRRPDAVLLVVGEGPEAHRVRSHDGASVRFVGTVQDVRPWLAAADLFVLPSSTEGMSNSLLEAVASGLRVVASSVGGTVEIAQEHSQIHLVRPADVAALTAGILAGLGQQHADAVSRQAPTLQVATVHTAARRLVAAYHHVLGGPPLSGQGHHCDWVPSSPEQAR